MKSDELISDYCFDVTDNQTKAVYPKADVDAAIDELKDELNRAKVREDVLVTDNRNLLDKVKMLEERLRENAEHFKRNEAQILENAEKVIAEKDKEIAELQKQVHDYAQGLYVIQERAEKKARHHKYKRCLAMAKRCLWNKLYWRDSIPASSNQFKWENRVDKWHKRWLAIAEKFKPNKEAK